MQKRRRKHNQSSGSELVVHHAALRHTGRGGVVVQGLHFDSTELQILAAKISGPISIKINYTDLSKILVHDPVRDVWFSVSSVDMHLSRKRFKKLLNKKTVDGRLTSYIRRFGHNGTIPQTQLSPTEDEIGAINWPDK